MDKIIVDDKSFAYIGEWVEENKPQIKRVPRVLDHFVFEYLSEAESENVSPDGVLFSLEVKWVSEDQIQTCGEFYSAAGKRRLNWETTFDYDYTKLLDWVLAGKLPGLDEKVVANAKPEGYMWFGMGHGCIGKNKSFNIENEKHTQMANYSITILIYVLYFMANYEADLITYVENETERVEVKKKKNRKQYKTKRTTTIRLQRYVSDVKNGVKKLPRHNKKCQYAFGVRGHYRHYKSGKVVWIEPYQKNTLEHKMKRMKKDTTYKFDLKRGDSGVCA